MLRDLVFAKYGKQYDLSIVRRQIAGVTIVALNVMWTHLDQRSFPMSEPEFMEKLDTIAEYLRQATPPSYILPSHLKGNGKGQAQLSQRWVPDGSPQKASSLKAFIQQQNLASPAESASVRLLLSP